MSWQKNVTEKISDYLRFAGYACLAIDAILLALFSVWFVSKLAWFTLNWLNRVIFPHYW